MTMRSTWKGHIRMGLVSAPVKLYNATEMSEKVSLNLVHQCSDKKTGAVGYVKVCKACEKQLAAEEIVKGYKVSEDGYAIITKDELANIKLKSTKIIDIDAFVPLDQIPLSHYSEPKFITPDGDVGVKFYALIRDAMAKTGRVGVGKVVLRDREDVVVLVPNGNGIDMYVLRYPKEVRSHSEIPNMDKVAAHTVDKTELDLAIELTEALHSNYSDVEMVDHYNDALRQLVNDKIAGKSVTATAPAAAKADNTMDALRASIAQAKKAKDVKPIAQPAPAKTKKTRKSA